MPWWTTSSSEAGTQEAYYGCNPAQSNLGFQAKTQKARQVLQPASQGTHSSHSGHGLPHPEDGGLAHLSTWSAHLLHQCRGLSTLTRTQQLSTPGSLSFPLSRNITVTLFLPGQLKRPWAQLPGNQNKPQLLSQKYLLPQWPCLMTPFLRGAQGGCGGGRMLSSRLGRAETD